MEKKKKTWFDQTFYITCITGIGLPLFTFFITQYHNNRQLEITRVSNIAGIIKEIGVTDLKDENKRIIVLALSAFEEYAIPTLIYFMKDEDTETRNIAVSSVENIVDMGRGHKEVKNRLRMFILSELIPAYMKVAAIKILDNIDKKFSINVRNEFAQRMSQKNNDKRKDPLEDPFQGKEIVLSLFRLGTKMEKAYLPDIQLKYEDLTGINLKGAYLEGAKFHNIFSLKDAIFDGADLTNAEFHTCNFEGASFKNTICDGIKIKTPQNFKHEYFKGHRHRCSDFKNDEFGPHLTIEKLCKVIVGNYSLSLSSSNNAIGDLNEILTIPDFYDKLNGKGSNINFPESITDLVDKTKDYRNKSFSDLNDDEKDYIKRLNRLILENTYPDYTPKSQCPLCQ